MLTTVSSYDNYKLKMIILLIVLTVYLQLYMVLTHITNYIDCCTALYIQFVRDWMST